MSKLLLTFMLSLPLWLGAQIDTSSTDSDSDGILNTEDIDWDNDGIPNLIEYCSSSSEILITSEQFTPITLERSGDISTYKTESFLDFSERFAFNQGDAMDGTLILGPFESSEYITFDAVLGKDYAISNGGGHVKARIEILDASFDVKQTIFWDDNTSNQTGEQNELSINFIKNFKGSAYIKVTDNGSVGTGTANDWSFVRLTYSGLNPCDSDNDGYPNHLDLDSDGDNCPDLFEGGAGKHTESSISDSPDFVGFGSNGLADHVELSVDTGVLKHDLNYAYLDPLEDLCKDTDNDGILNIYDIDDDNDGVPDSMELADQSNLLKDLVDGSFESLSSVAQVERCNSNVTAGGWFNGAGSCDSWQPNPTACYGNTAPPSPNGGVFVGCWGYKSGTSESFFIQVNGLQAGKKYLISFYQRTNGQFGIFQTRGQWRVVFGDEVQRSDLMGSTNLRREDPVIGEEWQHQELIFTATRTNQVLQFFAATDVGAIDDVWNYSLIDGIELLAYEDDEFKDDYDRDGIVNMEDLDSDNDGCPDRMEAGAAPSADVDTMAAEYGENGLANVLEITDDVETGLKYDPTYNYAIDSNINRCEVCYECSNCDKTGCPVVVDGYLSDICPNNNTNVLANVPVLLLNDQLQLVESTTTDENGYYKLYATEGSYFIQVNGVTLTVRDKEALSNKNGNHLNYDYLSDNFFVTNSDVRINGTFDAAEVLPIIDSLPDALPSTCLPDLSMINPVLNNTLGSITLDSTVYRTEEKLDSIWYFWTALSECGFSSMDSLKFVPLELSLELSSDTLYTCAADLGTALTVEVTEGEAPFEYAWSSAVGQLSNADSATSLFVYDQIGDYPVEVLVKNAEGCQKTDTLMVSVAKQDMSVKILGDSLYCERDVINLYPSKELESVEWIRPNGVQVEADSLIIPNVTLGLAGTYKMIAGFKGACIDTIEKVLIVQRSITPRVNGDDTYCQGQTIRLEAPNFENYSFEWSLNDSVISRSNPLIYSTENLAVGTHDFILFVKPESGCGGFAVNTITVESSGDLKLPKGGAVCKGNQFETTIEDVKSAFWIGPNNFISTTASISIPSVGAEESGYYSYIIETNTGCNIVDSVLIEGVDPVIPNIAEETIDCGAKMKFKGLGADTLDFTWNYAGTQRVGDSVVYDLENKESGTIQVKGSYKGCETSISFDFTPNVEQFDYDFVVEAETCDALGKVSLARKPTDIKYTWLDLDGDSTTFDRELPRGEYALWVRKNDCDTTFTFSISKDCDEVQQPFLTGLLLDYCSNEPLKNIPIALHKADGSLVETFTTNGAGRFQYEATAPSSFYLKVADSITLNSTGNSSIAISSNKSETFVLSGDLSFEATYEQDNNYSISGATEYCLSEEVKLEVEPGGVIAWSGPNGFESTDNTIIIESLTPQDTGLYTVIQTIGDCEFKDSVRITIVKKTLNLVTNSPICSGEELRIQSNQAVGLEYEGVEAEDTIFRLPNMRAGVYDFDFTIEDECFTNTTFTVEVFEIAYELTKDTNNCELDEYTLSIEGTSNAIWTGPNNFRSTSSSATIDLSNPETHGVYEVRGITTDGCNLVDEVAINTDVDCPSDGGGTDGSGTDGGGTDGGGIDGGGTDGGGTDGGGTDGGGTDGGGTDGGGTDGGGTDGGGTDGGGTDGGGTDGGGTDFNPQDTTIIIENFEDSIVCFSTDIGQIESELFKVENGNCLNVSDQKGRVEGQVRVCKGSDCKDITLTIIRKEILEPSDTLKIAMTRGEYNFCLPILTSEIAYLRPLCMENSPLKEVSIDSLGCITMNGFEEEPLFQCYEVCYPEKACDTFNVLFYPEFPTPVAVEDSFTVSEVSDLNFNLINNDTIPFGLDSIKLIGEALPEHQVLFDGSIQLDEMACGEYVYNYVIYSKGKQDTAFLKFQKSCNVDVYNGISRNGDGINDHLVIQNIESYPNNRVMVFNRQGHKIFERSGYTNEEPWVGDFDGATLPAGTYFYVVNLGDEVGTSISGYLFLD